MNDKIQTTTSIGDTGLAKKRTIGLPSLHKRMSAPQSDATSDAKPNRIALLLDCSGSMSGSDDYNATVVKSKIDLLKDAMTGFVNACNFADTALAIETFPSGDHDESEIGAKSTRVPLTTLHPFLMTSVMMLRAGGGTPMAVAMRYAVSTYSLTRAVLVSDGDADNSIAALREAETYKEAGVPCDCVHIGQSAGGEETLKEIARVTGGMFMKFTDVSSFAKNFRYLTPAFYAQLTSGSVTAAQLGAKEIK
jgi:uncharacterized protein YegL